ncbi:MAG: sigma-70 family RNA polymerase sigma factor [Planctomycetota bacterium]
MFTINTQFVARLKEHDGDAWFELWEVFGPTIERMVYSLSSRYFSQETVKDISQETLMQLFEEIGRFDTQRGVKFSTWLYAIAKHIVASELTYRNALKRNKGVKPLSLSETFDEGTPVQSPQDEFEREVFRAKVYRAFKLVEKKSDFLEFEVYKMKISRKIRSLDIAAIMGISEASVSRYLKKIRERLRRTLAEVVREYSWTEEEFGEIGKNRLDSADEAQFDAAIGDIYLQMEQDHRSYDRLSKTARGIF